MKLSGGKGWWSATLLTNSGNYMERSSGPGHAGGSQEDGTNDSRSTGSGELPPDNLGVPDFLSYEDLFQLIDKAVSTNNKTLLKRVFDKYPNDVLNLLDPNLGQKSFLHHACKIGCEDIVLLLLNYGADRYKDVEMKEGTPLKLACEFGHAEIVDVLIGCGVVCPVPEISPRNPIYLAVQNGHSDVISCFKRYNNGELLSGHYNASVLQYGACYYGHAELVRYFLQTTDVHVNAPVQRVPLHDIHNADKLTPMYAACKGNHDDIVYLLSREGADITPHLLDNFPDILKTLVQKYIVPYEPAISSDDLVDNPLMVRWKRCHLYISEIPYDWLSQSLDFIAEVDISRNKLKYLPSWLPWKLPNIVKFDASHNDLLRCVPPQDVHCEKLREIHLSHNSLDAVPMRIFQLKSLKYLTLKENLLTELPPGHGSSMFDTGNSRASSTYERLSGGFVDLTVAWTCENLRELDVSHNRLKEIPIHIQSTSRLAKLDVSYNRLIQFPAPWPCEMENLNVSHNELEIFISNVETLWSRTLRSLRLDNNQLTEIDPGICAIITLTSLRLSHNKLKGLPATTYWKCSQLESLDLARNRLGDQERYEASLKKRKRDLLLKPIWKRQREESRAPITQIDLPDMFSEKLRYLSLRGNFLYDIPPTAFKMKSLETLDLRDNQITELPNELGKLSASCDLRVDDIAMKNIPKDVLNGPPRFPADPGTHLASRQVLTYLRTKLRKSSPYHRMKLVIVGKEGRGKTTLLSVLQGHKYEENISTHGVAIKEWRINPNKPFTLASRPPVTFSTWDMAGQKDYYVTHQCFISPNALYLVVWDLTLHNEGVLNLRPWLLNIQARAPGACVIIIGTFLDRLDPDPKERERKVNELKTKINQLFSRPGFPLIRGIAEVSCKTMKGIPELKELIYNTALNMADAHSPNEKLLGRLVPSSFLELEKLVVEEAKRRKKSGEHPVLLEEEFENLVKKIPQAVRDIDTPEERNQVAKFLHETGILLHYSDQHRALNSLYFIDPSWLCDMLAAVINFENVQNGMLRLSKVKSALTKADEKRFPQTLFQEYLHLLERFDIGLQLDDERLLIPSKLGSSRPAVTSGNEDVLGSEQQKLYRWYKMEYVPSGFWSRLIVRILVGIRQQKHLLSLRSSQFPQAARKVTKDLSKQWSLKGSHRAFHLKDNNQVWWRHGIVVNHQDGYFIVESSSAVFADPTGFEGILVTVYSTVGNFSAMGFVADLIDSLIAEWFPGLEGLNDRGEPTISRIIPCPYCIKMEEEDPEDYSTLLRICHFMYEDCAVAALENDNCTISCDKHPQAVPLIILVPDLLLADLPSRLFLDVSELLLEETEENRLGQGGYASVYRAKFKRKEVAAKVFHSAVKFKDASRNRNAGGASFFGDTTSTEVASEASEADFPMEQIGRSHQLDSLRISFEDVGIQAIQMFRELRSEVALMAKLRHPCIVTLIATSVKPPCFLLELAPMGSLQSVLENELKEKGFKDSLTRYRTKDTTQPSVLSKMLTYKLVLQIALAIRYLHKYNIIYRDLKSQNVLVWNLDLNKPVNVKLSDYGISCFNTPQGIMGNEGTPGYQAPEIQTGVAYDEKVDLFSLAMTIYEIISGHHPLDHYHYPGQVIQAVRKGERPSLQELNIDSKFPCLESLMKDCWNAGPESRPSANDVVRLLKRTEFVCQERLLPQADQGLICSVDCIYAPYLKSKNQFVWIWGGQNDDRVFSVLDVERGVFRANKKSCPGPKAMCTTRVGNTMWIGNKGNEIEIFGYRKTGLPETLRVIYLESTPLHMLYETTEETAGPSVPSGTSEPSGNATSPQKVYVAQESGIISVFSCADPASRTGDEETGRRNVAIALSIQKEPHQTGDTDNWTLCTTIQLCQGENSDTPATCLEKVAAMDEIWVGCENSIAIISSKTLKVKGPRIPLKQMTFVKQLKSFGKRVWCLQQWSCEIIEFDAESRTQRYLFNCMDAKINAVIAERQFEPEAAFGNEDIDNPVVRRGRSNPKSSSSSRDRVGGFFTEVAIDGSKSGEEPESLESRSGKDLTADAHSELSSATGAVSSATGAVSSATGAVSSATGAVASATEAVSPGAMLSAGAVAKEVPNDFGKQFNENLGKKRNVFLEEYFKNTAAMKESEQTDYPIKPEPPSPGSSIVDSIVKSLTKGDTAIRSEPASQPDTCVGTLKSNEIEKCLDMVKEEILSDKFGESGEVVGLSSQTLPNQKINRKIGRRRGVSEWGKKMKKFNKDDIAQIMHQVRSLLVVRDQTLWIGQNSGDIIVVSIDDSSLCYNPYGQVLSVLETKDMEGHKNGRIRHLVGVGPDRVLATRLFHKAGSDGSAADLGCESGDEDDDASCAVYQLVVWEAYGCEEFYRVQTLWNQLRTAEIEKEGKL
ncbi:leucine-rich repeat serine/threonine-protein kinase 1-like isoform X2 [Lineus longissimus]|uniref:leucine-rich repeat serine/threonine-protein kinase 1-like isoform X2 n=1 Tax=Lineus longissimus TaxID=88925 RepID=UPI00315D17AC